MLARAWAAICAFFAPAPPPSPAITPEDGRAIVDFLSLEPAGGWYAWECAQYRATGAFWFDHARYDGTRFAFSPPSISDLRANYTANYREAIARHGPDLVDRATYWTLVQRTALGHRSSLAPIDWCIAEYQAVGCPLIEVPFGWSPHLVEDA